MKNWKTTAEAILTSGPVVPVIVAEKSWSIAVPMPAKALVAGGVRVEVTLRTEAPPRRSARLPKKFRTRLSARARLPTLSS
ncbi:hypothetical protein MJ561_18785 [Klebsiella pneumoniae]|nr:hypothetical protein MJ561_18785 [Klebsiella pneumoniae]